MSDDANEIFDASPDGNVEDRAPGTDDATPDTGDGDEVTTPPTDIGGVDVSMFSGEFREFLSTQDSEIGEAIARESRTQYDDMKRNQTKKHQELGEWKRKLEAQSDAAALGTMIQGNPELMQRVMGLAGEAEATADPLPAMDEIDFSTNEGQSQLVRSILGHPEARSMVQQMATEIADQRTAAMPIVRRDALRGAASGARAQLAESGTSLTDKEWSVITNHWANSKGSVENALATDPQEAMAQLAALGSIASQMNGSTNVTQPLRSTSAPSPSGGSSTPLRVQKAWEKEKRPMTTREIFDHAGGTKPGDLEKALEKAKASGKGLLG